MTAEFVLELEAWRRQNTLLGGEVGESKTKTYVMMVDLIFKSVKLRFPVEVEDVVASYIR